MDVLARACKVSASAEQAGIHSVVPSDQICVFVPRSAPSRLFVSVGSCGFELGRRTDLAEHTHDDRRGRGQRSSSGLTMSLRSAMTSALQMERTMTGSFRSLVPERRSVRRWLVRSIGEKRVFVHGEVVNAPPCSPGRSRTIITGRARGAVAVGVLAVAICRALPLVVSSGVVVALVGVGIGACLVTVFGLVRRRRRVCRCAPTRPADSTSESRRSAHHDVVGDRGSLR